MKPLTDEQIEEVKRQMKPCPVCGNITCLASSHRILGLKEGEKNKV